MLSKNINSNTFQVTCAEELKFEWFNNVNIIGISAGASTPDYLINEVRERIENIGDR